MNKKHRPIVISEGLLSKKEKTEFLRLGNEICKVRNEYEAKLSSLIAEWRKLVGFTSTDLTFDENQETMFSGGYEPKDWIEDAYKYRKMWALEELKELQD